jgi:hypothetical protein
MAKDRANYHHFPALLQPACFFVKRQVLADGASFCEPPRFEKKAGAIGRGQRFRNLLA